MELLFIFGRKFASLLAGLRAVAKPRGRPPSGRPASWAASERSPASWAASERSPASWAASPPFVRLGLIIFRYFQYIPSSIASCSSLSSTLSPNSGSSQSGLYIPDSVPIGSGFSAGIVGTSDTQRLASRRLPSGRRRVCNHLRGLVSIAALFRVFPG